MTTLILLHDREDEEPFYLNPACIFAVWPRSQGGSIINVIDDECDLNVRESMDVIAKLIRREEP